MNTLNYLEVFETHLPKRLNLALFDFGGGGASAARSASAAQVAATERAAQTQEQMYRQTRADLAPWVSAGGTALGQYGSMLGLPGYPTVDPTAQLQATPGYQWGLGQGVQALDRSAASRGMLLSGPQQKGLTQFGQQYGLTQAYQPYMSALSGLSGQGLGAAGQTGAYGMQAAGQMGQDYLLGGQAQAQGIINAYNAQQQGQQNLFGGLGILGGIAGSVLGGPLGGAIGGGLGSLLGSLGGGGGGLGAPTYTSPDYYPGGYGYQNY